MPDHSTIALQSSTTAPAAAKDVMPVQEQLQTELEIQPVKKNSIQFKLSIGVPDDSLEHEADAMADTIMRMPEQNFIQRKCSHCEEEEKLQRKPLVPFIQRKESSAAAMASDTVSNQINSSRGSGSGMDNNTQSFMQSRFGADFSDVKIHTGGEAIQMNRELNAKAFTVGNDIYFNESQYNPNSTEGKHLLAHELTHTIQQENKKIVQRQKDVVEDIGQKKNIPLSRGVLQFVSEGGFSEGENDTRKPTYPQNVALFQELTDPEKKKYDEAIKDKKAVPFKRYSDPSDIMVFELSQAGNYKLVEIKDRFKLVTYTAKLESSQKLGVLPTAAGSQSGVTIGMGLDIGNKFSSSAVAEKWLKSANLDKDEKGEIIESKKNFPKDLGSSAGLKGIKAAEKAAKLRESITLTYDDVLKLLDNAIKDYDNFYSTKKRPYKRGNGIFHPAVEEAMMNVTYWGRIDLWNKMYDAGKGKKDLEQIKSVRDTTKSFSEKKYYYYYNVIIEMMEAGYTVEFSDNVKVLDELTGSDDKTFDLVRDIVERKSGFTGSKDLKKQLGKGELTKIINKSVGVGGTNETEDVKNIQQMLYNGDYDVEVTGVYNDEKNKTEAAILKFIKDNGKKVSLIKPGKELEKRLRALKYKTRTPGTTETNTGDEKKNDVKEIKKKSLDINQSQNSDEKEADRMADKVMRMEDEKSVQKEGDEERTPLEEAQDLLNEVPLVTKDRAAWILKAEVLGFVKFDTSAARKNVQDIKDEKKVQHLDPKEGGYEISILEVEIGLVKELAQRWVDAGGVGAKSSIQFGSMIRSNAKDVHGQGKAIDINNLSMAASVTAAEQILSDLDATIHSSYGLGMPFQGDFFDPSDEITTKKKAAETAAEKDSKTANITDCIEKFASHIYKSTGTKGDDGIWTWSKPTIQEAGAAYKKLKSQSLKDKLATRRKDGINFVIFPDNNNHLHLDVR